MNKHTNTRFGPALASVLLALATLGWHPGAGAQSPPPSSAPASPHPPETPGLSVHANQGLRHPSSKSTFGSGLTVKVTPVAMGSAGWEFKVRFETVREVPADNVQGTTVLIVDGKEYKPTGWKIATAGVHRREGVLSFPGAGSSAKLVEVRMQREGEKSARVFRWKDAELASGKHPQAFPHEPAGKAPAR